MWQTDFTYFKIIGWGWIYLSTVLMIPPATLSAGKLCSTMRAEGRQLALLRSLRLGATSIGYIDLRQAFGTVSFKF